MVYLSGHSFVKRLFSRVDRRSESVAQSLRLEGKCQFSGYGQGGLTSGSSLTRAAACVTHDQVAVSLTSSLSTSGTTTWAQWIFLSPRLLTMPWLSSRHYNCSTFAPNS